MLWLSSALAKQIIAHAHEEAPHEVCGLLVGDAQQVTQVIPVANVAQDPEHHYMLDPHALSQHLPQIVNSGQELIGFYHSHPSGKPIPSPTDIKEAHYPDSVYLIVGLAAKHTEIAAWHINNLQVDRVNLHISDSPPEFIATPETPDLSTAQRNAIILSALFAVLMVITLSLALLPAPPPLP